MSIAHTGTFLVACIAIGSLSLHIVDATTGQGMPGLHVTIRSEQPGAHWIKHERTDAGGNLKLRLAPGVVNIKVESKDVPPQEFHENVRDGGSTSSTLKVCSTTLDYHCAAAGGGG